MKRTSSHRRESHTGHCRARRRLCNAAPRMLALLRRTSLRQRETVARWASSNCVHSPRDRKAFADIPDNPAAEVDAALAAASSIARSGWDDAAPKGADALREPAAALRNDSERLAELESRDCGKPKTTAAPQQHWFAGTVWINSSQAIFPQTPFGGWKASGFGREFGAAGLDEHLKHKTVTRAASRLSSDLYGNHHRATPAGGTGTASQPSRGLHSGTPRRWHFTQQRRRRISTGAVAAAPQSPASRPASAALVSQAPVAPPCSSADVGVLADHVVGASGRLLVLTGAGISTASGIPDYRSPNGSYSRGHRPIQHAEFVRSLAARRRYWSRSFVGWQYFSRAQPNVAHLCVAAMQAEGLVQQVITQNVDGLHSAAGSSHVLDLHGRIDKVECLECGDVSPRANLQTRLGDANAQWAADIESLGLPTELRADGDSEIEVDLDHFSVPDCLCCSGPLKPAVTFFGGSVPSECVKAAADAVAGADALLVIGSSLQVFSAFRIARAASRASIPIAILNNGPTRADDLATLRVQADACEALPRVLEQVRSLLDPKGAVDPPARSRASVVL
jgi:NAD-dependent deacetylase sirtuin 4